MKKRLGVNIDHVATIRNARGEVYPEPLRAAVTAERSGADSITIHLREDRRHIIDADLKKIKRNINIPLNLEIAPTREMLKIAVRQRPDYVCFVPEKRTEVTTEGGLNLRRNFSLLKKFTRILKNNKIRVSLFIEPKISDVKLSSKIGTDCVEFHTGKFCSLYARKKNYKNEFIKLKNAAILAKKLFLEVHAGHGITYKSLKPITKIKEIHEYNIGHFIVSEAIFHGLKNVIFTMKKIIQN
tara:strand:- start:632 stop:1354 length:723 start_codon:yes stop_codon:yes gene_type:complete